MPIQLVPVGPVITLKKDEAYALPAKEVLCDSSAPLEFSQSQNGPWTNDSGIKTAYSDLVIVDGAVAYWRLNETSGTTVKSLVAGVPDGTISGAVTLGVNGALLDGDKAMSFNPAGAADGRIAIPVGSYSAIGIGPASIECWFNCTTANDSFLFGTTPISLGDFNHLGLFRWSNNLFYFRGYIVGGAQVDVTTSLVPLLDGKWHHAVGVLRRGSINDTHELWIDGVLKGSNTAPTGRNYTASQGSMIGAAGAGTVQEWLGQIDECAIYKTALTPTQIQSHYAARLNTKTTSYPSLVVSDGAVAYWRLNETSGTTVRSIVGGVPDGTINGAILNQAGALSDNDKAMRLDGIDDRLTIPNFAEANFGAESFTIEAWVNIVGGTYQVVISKGSSAVPGWRAFITSANKLQLFWGNDSQNYVATSASIPINTWTHVVWGYNATTGSVLYAINGIYTSSIVANQPVTNSANIVIGMDSTPSYPVNGLIDECAIYKVALTPEQILSHYNARTVKTPTYSDRVIGDGAVAYWRLNETSGTIVKSLVSGVPDGTISGGVTLGVSGVTSDGDGAISFTTGKIDGSTLDLPITYSIEAWILTTPAGIQRGIFSMRPGNATPVVYINPSETLSSYRSLIGPLPSSSKVIADNKWHHIVATFDAGFSRLYVDGTLDGQVAMVSPQIISGEWHIAIDPGSPAAFNGLIDEVAIYKTALTPQQIAEHYEARLVNPRQNSSKGGFVRSSVDSMIICKSC